MTDNSFDLVTVAQAVHWFDFDKFYEGVKPVSKRDGEVRIALWCCGMHKVNPKLI